MQENNKYEDIASEMSELRMQLTEAKDTIEAIRTGEVDAFVVTNGHGHEIYTLKSADLNYRILVEKMAEGAVTLNKDARVSYCNASFAELVALPMEEVLGASFDSLIPSPYKNIVAKLVSSGWQEECKAEIQMPGETHKAVPVLLSVNPLEIDGLPALSIIVTDLSFQKQSQEHKIAMDKKDEFISIASHELRTPVTSIKGYIQLLKYTFQQAGNAEAADLLSKADVQINKLTTLINDLLDVKKIESGQLTYREEVFEFNELVREIIEETGRVQNRHLIHCSLDTAANVYADRNKLGQVISNFIDNAAKYSSVGTAISITTNTASNNIRLTVKDEGMGIPKEQQGRIFERFFRVSSEKENTYSGLGLGLYISAEIIKRHGGNIGVESETGNGATFYFEIPKHQL